MAMLRTVNGTVVPSGEDAEHGGRSRVGRIEAITWDDEHGDAIAYVVIAFKGFVQGFGGLMLPPKTLVEFLQAVGTVAGRGPGCSAAVAFVGTPKFRSAIQAALIGAEVTGLWPTGAFNESMEGIAGPGGLLTLTGFSRSAGFEPMGTLERERARLEREVEWAERTAARARQEASALESTHVDWNDGAVQTALMKGRSGRK